MFQLIVAVVAILLIAILAIAAYWYGGGVYDESKARAEYAQHMNSAAQIEGAMQLYYNDHARNVEGEDEVLLQNLLAARYLKDIPQGEWRVRPDTLYRPIEVQQVKHCALMNKAAGFDISDSAIAAEPWEGCPPCNGAEGSSELALAEAYRNWPGCQFID